MNLTALFDEAIDKKASDIHLASGEAPRMRISGELIRSQEQPISADSLMNLLSPLTTPESRVRLESGLALEKSILHRNIVFSVIAFRVGDGELAATFRLLSNEIPPLDQVGNDALPLLQKVKDSARGLALITGPDGSGKSTVLCSIVEEINRLKAARIFVTASQPYYQFESKKGMVTQLRIGQDCESYVRALEICHRSDLDCVAIDDIPDADTLRQALILAETGHLVLANIHADSVQDAFRRIFHAAGPHATELQRSLAHNLIAVTTQKLFKRTDKPGRIATYEWFTVNSNTRQALLEGDLNAIETLISSDPDCQAMNISIRRLEEAGQISPEQT